MWDSINWQYHRLHIYERQEIQTPFDFIILKLGRIWEETSKISWAKIRPTFRLPVVKTTNNDCPSAALQTIKYMYASRIIWRNVFGNATITSYDTMITCFWTIIHKCKSFRKSLYYSLDGIGGTSDVANIMPQWSSNNVITRPQSKTLDLDRSPRGHRQYRYRLAYVLCSQFI